MKTHTLLGNIGQWLGLVVVLAGILILTEKRVDPGGLSIAAGSFIFAIGTKAKHEIKGKKDGD